MALLRKMFKPPTRAETVHLMLRHLSKLACIPKGICQWDRGVGWYTCYRRVNSTDVKHPEIWNDTSETPTSAEAIASVSGGSTHMPIYLLLRGISYLFVRTLYWLGEVWGRFLAPLGTFLINRILSPLWRYGVYTPLKWLTRYVLYIPLRWLWLSLLYPPLLWVAKELIQPVFRWLRGLFRS